MVFWDPRGMKWPISFHNPLHDYMGIRYSEPLLGIIREQGEWPLRHKGTGSKDQISQWSREHENYNQGAGSTIFVSKKAAERKPLTNLDL